MIDYILKFETQAQAKEALPDWTIVDGSGGRSLAS